MQTTETNPQFGERDAKLARRLGEAIDQLSPQTSGHCPDAEIIAAYSERALAADEVAQCENHFASCGRCRNILKVLAAASDAPLAETEVAQLGQRVSDARAPIEITLAAAKRPRTKAAAWRTRWLAPAFGVAAVLTVWLVMRQPWRAMDRSGSTTLVAEAPQQEMPEPAPLAVDRAQKVAPTQQTPPAKMSAPDTNAEFSGSVNLKSRDSLHEISPNAGLAKSLPAEKKEDERPESANKAKTLAELALPSAPPPEAALAVPPSAATSAMNSPTPMPQMRARADSAAPVKSSEPSPARQSAEATDAVPRSESASRAVAVPAPQQAAKDVPLNGRNFQALGTLRSAQRPLLLLKAASGISMWRAGVAGVIELSADQGKTWTPQMSPSSEDWLAGTAVSDAVCWLAGRNGAIAKTTDGKNWLSVAPPSQVRTSDGKWPAWMAVAAQSAESASVTAADGAKFFTTDGGKTWQRQP